MGRQGADPIVVGPEEKALVKSFRNIPGIEVLEASAIGVADILGAGSLVASQAALEVLEARSAEVNRKADES